jgi:hypothetical protein
VCFRDGSVAAGQSHELFGEVIDGTIATEENQFVDGALHQRWPEAFVNHLYEAGPRRWTDIELQPMIPQLGIIGQLE